MRSVLLMSFANIRRRKTQTALIGLTLLMASLLLATAIGMIQGIQRPVETMLESQKASHATMMMWGQSGRADDVVAWWDAREEVEGVVRFPYRMVEEDVRRDGTVQSMGSIMLTEHPAVPSRQDQLRIVEGSAASSPGDGEIWLPTGYAYSWTLSVGDSLEIPVDGEYRSFMVSAIVVDPQFSASMMNPVRAWVSDGYFAEVGVDRDELGYLIGVRLWDAEQYDELWQGFEEYLDAPYVGFVFDHVLVTNAYSMIQNILAVIVLAFASFVVLIGVFVLGFAIVNAVAADYRLIGILKAQGFSSRNVRWIYISHYVLLAGVAAPVGVFASTYAVNAILRQMARSLGVVQPDAPLLLPAIVTLSAILTTVLLASSLASSRAGRIEPAEAIRSTGHPGRRPRTRTRRFSGAASLPVPAMLAARGLFDGKTHAVFLLSSGTALALVLTFSVNVFHSVKNLAENHAYWGFDDADVHLSANANTELPSRDEILRVLQGDERVAVALPYQVMPDAAIPAQSGRPSKNVIGFSYHGDMDAIGAMNLEGANPRQADEVSISYMAAQEYGKHVGDRIDLYLEGEKGSYLVTGVYQCINAMGWGIRIQEGALRDINPDAWAENYTVKLSGESDIVPFVDEMTTMLGDSYTVRAVAESGEINLSGITDNIALVALLISAIFAVVCFVIVFNAIAMEIHGNRRSLGIYSAVGMTAAQIRATMLWKAVAVSGLGVVLGIVAALLVSPHVLSLLIGNLGMAWFPFDVNILGTLAVIPVCLAVVVASAWLPSGRVLSISPRELVVE